MWSGAWWEFGQRISVVVSETAAGRGSAWTRRPCPCSLAPFQSGLSEVRQTCHCGLVIPQESHRLFWEGPPYPSDTDRTKRRQDSCFEIFKSWPLVTKTVISLIVLQEDSLAACLHYWKWPTMRNDSNEWGCLRCKRQRCVSSQSIHCNCAISNSKWLLVSMLVLLQYHG